MNKKIEIFFLKNTLTFSKKKICKTLKINKRGGGGGGRGGGPNKLRGDRKKTKY